MIYVDFSKKCHVILKKLFLLFWKFLSYLVFVSSFKSRNSSSLSRKKKKKLGIISISHPVSNYDAKIRQWTTDKVHNRVHWTTEPSDKLFFKRCILQTILHVFSLFIFVQNKIFCSKTWAVLEVTVFEILGFWWSFYKVIGSH